MFHFQSCASFIVRSQPPRVIIVIHHQSLKFHNSNDHQNLQVETCIKKRNCTQVGKCFKAPKPLEWDDQKLVPFQLHPLLHPHTHYLRLQNFRSSFFQHHNLHSLKTQALENFHKNLLQNPLKLSQYDRCRIAF